MGWFSYDKRDLDKDLSDIDRALKAAKRARGGVHLGAPGEIWRKLVEAFDDLASESSRIEKKMDKASIGLSQKASQLSTVSGRASKLAQQISEQGLEIVRLWPVFRRKHSEILGPVSSEALLEMNEPRVPDLEKVPFGEISEWLIKIFEKPLREVKDIDPSGVRSALRILSEAVNATKGIDKASDVFREKGKLLDAACVRIDSLHSELVSRAKQVDWED